MAFEERHGVIIVAKNADKILDVQVWDSLEEVVSTVPKILTDSTMAVVFNIPSGENELILPGPGSGNIEDNCPGLLAILSGDQADDVPPSGKKSTAWLFSWNPLKYDWYDYDDVLEESKNGGYCGNWSCANSNARKGDRFYMVRLGRCDHRGIIASGTILSDPYTEGHYNDTDDNPRPMQYVDIRIENALDFDREPILEMSWLKLNLPVQNWAPQQSGIRIRETCTDALFDEWEAILGLGK